MLWIVDRKHQTTEKIRGSFLTRKTLLTLIKTQTVSFMKLFSVLHGEGKCVFIFTCSIAMLLGSISSSKYSCVDTRILFWFRAHLTLLKCIHLTNRRSSSLRIDVIYHKIFSLERYVSWILKNNLWNCMDSKHSYEKKTFFF